MSVKKLTTVNDYNVARNRQVISKLDEGKRQPYHHQRAPRGDPIIVFFNKILFCFMVVSFATYLPYVSLYATRMPICSYIVCRLQVDHTHRYTRTRSIRLSLGFQQLPCSIRVWQICLVISFELLLSCVKSSNSCCVTY